MRRLISFVVVVVALAIPTVAQPAELSNGASQNCDGIAVWHFVNNQTGGAGAGFLEADFTIDGVAVTLTASPSSVLKSTQHFFIETEGDAVLVDASTNLPGRLQLSDLSCDDGGKKK